MLFRSAKVKARWRRAGFKSPSARRGQPTKAGPNDYHTLPLAFAHSAMCCPRLRGRLTGRFLSRSALLLLILLLLGLVLLFAYHLLLTLVLILFSAFVSHCRIPFLSLFTCFA